MQSHWNQSKQQQTCSYVLPIQGLETHLQASTGIQTRGTLQSHCSGQGKAGPHSTGSWAHTPPASLSPCFAPRLLYQASAGLLGIPPNFS